MQRNPILDLPENVRLGGSGYRTVRGGTPKPTSTGLPIGAKALVGAAGVLGAIAGGSLLDPDPRPEPPFMPPGSKQPAVLPVQTTPWFSPTSGGLGAGIIMPDSPRGLGKNEKAQTRTKKPSAHVTSTGLGAAHLDPIGTGRGSITTIGSQSQTPIIPPTLEEDSVLTPSQPATEIGGFGGGGGGGADRCSALLEGIKKMGLRAISNLPEDDTCLQQLYRQYGVNTKFALANAVSRAGGT
jgi:hypothetical protein